MSKTLKELVRQFGTSGGMVLVCMLLLLAALHTSRVDGISGVESFASQIDAAKQYHLVHFNEPLLNTVTRDGKLCTAIHLYGSQVTSEPNRTQLPQNIVQIPVADAAATEVSFESAKKSTMALDHPVCVESDYVYEHSFIDPEERNTWLTPKKGEHRDLPYPDNFFARKNLPDSKFITVVAYPVRVIAPKVIEVVSQITLATKQNSAQAAYKQLNIAPRYDVPKTQSLRVEVATSGMYELNGSLLDNIPEGTDPSDVRVFWRDTSLPRKVSVSGNKVTAIHFFVPQIPNTYYEDRAKIWVIWHGSGTENSFNSEDGNPSLQSAGSSIYQETTSVSQYNKHWHSLPIYEGVDADDDPIAPIWEHGYFYWQLQYAPGPFASKDYNFSADNVVANSNVDVRFRVRGLSYYTEYDPDHYVTFALNGSSLGNASFDQQEYVSPTLTLQTTLNEGTNSVNVTIPGGLVSGYESIAFYGFDVTYWRDMVANSNYLDFEVNSVGSYTVSNFGSNSVRVYRYNSDGSLVELSNLSISQQPDTSYSVNFAANQTGRYVAVQTDSYLVAEEAVLDTPSNLQNITLGAEFIVVAGHGLMSGAQKLATHRANMSGISTLVVDIQDILDEYNYGENDPQAIRDFLKDGWNSWNTKPKYLFLVGDSNFDPLGLYNAANRKPPLPYFYERAVYLAVANDNRMAFLSTTGPVPDVAVGRLPVATNTQIDDYLDKLTDYENSSGEEEWAKRILTINDDPQKPAESWEAPFLALKNWFAANTPSEYDLSQIDLNEVDGPTAEAEIAEDFDAGAGYVVYTGHSLTSAWGAEKMLGNNNISNLNTVAGKLPIVSSMTCLTGAFTTIFEDAMLETLIRAKDKGTIAAIGSSGMTFPTPQQQFAEAFTERLFANTDLTIGELLLDTRKYMEMISVSEDVVLSYNQFGDPAIIPPGFKGDSLALTEGRSSREEQSTPTIVAASDGRDGSAASANEGNISRSPGGCHMGNSGASNSTTLFAILFTLIFILSWRQSRLRKVRVKSESRKESNRN